MPLMELSEKEMAWILDERNKQLTPKLVAYLKEDLFEHEEVKIIAWFVSASEKEKYIQKFEKQFKIIAHKGEKFFGYLVNGEERWYPERKDCCVDDMPEYFAAKYLERIAAI